MSALQDICKRFPSLSSCQNKNGPPPPTNPPPKPAGGQLATPPSIPASGNDYCTNYKENFGAYCDGKNPDQSIVSFCNTYGIKCRGWNVPQTVAPAQPLFPSPTPPSPFATQPPVQPVQPIQPVQPVQPVQPPIGSGQALGNNGQAQKGLPNWLNNGQPLAGIGGAPNNLQQFGGPVNGGLGIGNSWQVPFVGASQGVNVAPTQGFLSGKSLNVAGLGFQQSSGINYGGLPGLANLNNAWGLGTNTLNGVNGGAGRRRRSITLADLLFQR